MGFFRYLVGFCMGFFLSFFSPAYPLLCCHIDYLCCIKIYIY